MLTMTIIAQIKPDKQQEFHQAISSLCGGGEEKGLIKFTLYQGVNDPHGFRIITEWETRQDLEIYLRTKKFKVLLGALGVLCKESEIRYSEKAEKVAATPKPQLLLPESSWRRNLPVIQEGEKNILEEKKEKP